MEELETLHERYRDRVAFFVVYIKEAHPEDGWVMNDNRRADIKVQDPTSDAERAIVAEACALRLKIRMPVLLDSIDNEVARQYGGWPDRLYLIDCESRVAFQGDKGPFGFRPEDLQAAIERELANAAPHEAAQP